MRKDRCIGGGGVFLALKNHLTFVDEPTFHGNAETVWVKLCLNESKPIYVYSSYRPPDSSSETLFELNNILTTIHECSVSPTILLAGDFNLPDLKFEDGIGYINRNPTYGYETNSLFVTGFGKTDPNRTFGISRINNLKYLTHCESLLLGCSHAIFAV